MKQLIIILTILTASQFCFSQSGTIKGHVQNNNEKKGLAFANVCLVNTNKKATTDLNGDFIFDNIPAGIYDLKISYIGFQDTTLTSIKVSNDTIIDLNIGYPTPCKNNQNDKTCPICKKKDKLRLQAESELDSVRLLYESEVHQIKLNGQKLIDQLKLEANNDFNRLQTTAEKELNGLELKAERNPIKRTLLKKHYERKFKDMKSEYEKEYALLELDYKQRFDSLTANIKTKLDITELQGKTTLETIILKYKKELAVLEPELKK